MLPGVLQRVGQPPREGVIRGMPRQPVALSVGCTCPCFRWFLFTGHQAFLVLFFKEGTWGAGGGHFSLIRFGEARNRHGHYQLAVLLLF